MKRTLVTLLVVGVLPGVAWAIPYASGVSQTGTDVTFVLNEGASNVQVDLGGNTLNLGALPAGTHSFNTGGAASYQIKVGSSTAPGWTQIGADQESTSFWVPVGVSVNRNPASPHFGSIYVSNAATGTPSAYGRYTPEGIYRMKADKTPINNGTAGVVWGGASGPFKTAIGADDRLYVADLSNDLAYDLAPDLSSGVQLIDATNRTANQWVAAIQVEGTQAGGDRKIYLVNSNYNDITRKGVIQYNLGGAAAVASGDTGSQLIGPNYFTYYPMDAVQDSSGNWYTGQYRYYSSEASALAKFLAGDLPGNTPTWEVPKVDPYNGSYCIDVYEPNGWVAYGNYYDGWVHIFDMNDGSYIDGFDAGNRMRDITFDAAGNIYTVDNSLEWMRAWSPGGDYLAITGSDGTFALVPEPAALVLLATAALAWLPRRRRR